MISLLLFVVNCGVWYLGAVSYVQDENLTGAATVVIATISLVITLITQIEGIVLKIRRFYLFLKRRDIPRLLRKMLADGRITFEEILEMVDTLSANEKKEEEKDDKS